MSELSMAEHNRRMELYNHGLKDWEIAEHCCVTDAAIFAWRKKNGIPPHSKETSSKKVRDKIDKRMKLYNAGMTDCEIANALHELRPTIVSWRKNMGLKPNRRVKKK